MPGRLDPRRLSPRPRTTAGCRAGAWQTLRDRLEAYLDDTEAGVVTTVSARVPRAGWTAILEQLRRGLTDRRGAGARVIEVATPDELALLGGQLGGRPLVGWRAHGRRRRADEALLFGAVLEARPGLGARTQDGR